MKKILILFTLLLVVGCIYSQTPVLEKSSSILMYDIVPTNTPCQYCSEFAYVAADDTIYRWNGTAWVAYLPGTGGGADGVVTSGTVSGDGNTLTLTRSVGADVVIDMTATNGDALDTNEGALIVSAGGANDADIASNTNGSTRVKIIGGTNMTVTENPATNEITLASSGGGSGTFTGLTDTPSSFTGQGNKMLLVNPAGNALIFADTAGIGGGGGAGIDSSFVTSFMLSNIIIANRYAIDVSNMTPYERGEALCDCINTRMNSDELTLIPPFEYKIPQSCGGLKLRNRMSIAGYDDRRTYIVADSSHAFLWNGVDGSYRSVISNITVETARTGEAASDSGSAVPDGTNQWDVFHFDPVTGSTRGVVVFDNVHVTEADRDIINIGANWVSLNFTNFSCVEDFDVGRYHIYSNANGNPNRFDINSPGITVFLDTGSDNQTVLLRGNGTINWTNNGGSGNNFIRESDLSMTRDFIGGSVPLLTPRLANPENIVFYNPLTPAGFRGDVLVDFSQKSTSGVKYGGLGFVSSEFGEVLSFDGIDDEIIIPVEDFDVADNKFAVSILIKPASDSPNGGILYGGGVIMRYRPQVAGTENDETGFQTTGADVVRGLDYIQDEWQHLCVVADGATVTYYINGSQVNTIGIPGGVTLDFGGTLTIGERFGYAKFLAKDVLFYDGYYDGINVDLYNSSSLNNEALTYNRLDVPLDAGKTVFYADLEDKTKLDLGVGRLLGTFTGTTADEGLYGSIGRTFDAVDDRILYASVDSMNSQNLYISAAVRGNTITNKRVLSKSNQFELFVKNDGLYGRFWHSGGTQVELVYSSYNTAEAGNYHHIGLGRLQDTLYLTYDGQIVVQQTVAGVTWDNNSNSLYVGASSTGSYWDGWIDEVYIANTFSDEFARQVYQKVSRGEPLIRAPEKFVSSEVIGLDNNATYTGTITPNRTAQFNNATGVLENGPFLNELGITRSTQQTAFGLPDGTTALRPAATAGDIRYNTDTNQFEGSRDGSTYENFTMGGISPYDQTFLGLTGNVTATIIPNTNFSIQAVIGTGDTYSLTIDDASVPVGATMTVFNSGPGDLVIDRDNGGTFISTSSSSTSVTITNSTRIFKKLGSNWYRIL